MAKVPLTNIPINFDTVCMTLRKWLAGGVWRVPSLHIIPREDLCILVKKIQRDPDRI